MYSATGNFQSLVPASYSKILNTMTSHPFSWIRLFGLSVLLPLLAGCLETQDQYSINPDGSGKVMHRAVFSVSTAAPDEEEQIRRVIRGEVDFSNGVEAWSDVDCRKLDDGRIEFRATAYFSDFNQLNFFHQGMVEKIKWQLINEPRGLTLRGVTAIPSYRHAGGSPPVPASSANELRKEFKTAQLNGSIPSKCSAEAVFQFGVPPQQLAGFHAGSDGNAIFSLTPGMYAALCDKASDDPRFLDRQFLAGNRAADVSEIMQDPLIQETMLGPAKTLKAVYPRRETPLFNYHAEVAQAKKQWPTIRKKFGLPEDFSPMCQEESDIPVVRLKSIKLGEFDGSLARASTDGRNLSFLLFWSQPPPNFIKITACKVENARTDTHEDLIRKDTPPMRAGNAMPTDFEVKLAPPSPRATTLQILAGTLGYLKGSVETQELELGFEAISAGSPGKPVGTVLRSINHTFFHPSWPRYEVAIPVSVASREQIKGLIFFDADGNRLPTEEVKRWTSGGSVFLHALANGSVARIGVELYSQVELRRVRFKVRPMKFI